MNKKARRNNAPATHARSLTICTSCMRPSEDTKHHWWICHSKVAPLMGYILL